MRSVKEIKLKDAILSEPADVANDVSWRRHLTNRTFFHGQRQYVANPLLRASPDNIRASAVL